MQKKILGDFSKWKFYFACQFVTKQYFMVKILDDVKQFDIRNFSSATFRKTRFGTEAISIWVFRNKINLGSAVVNEGREGKT